MVEMTYTTQSKSRLAKLMATENLTVEHQKLSTAKFDVKNRILYLPIWKDMTGEIYDLLTGHEVGHALYTPVQGWHDAVLEDNKPLSFKHFLNVVEDARIEKKIQRRYPGLRASFVAAYKILFDRDFFGIGNDDVNKLPFIDRLNIYSKSQYTYNIKFNNIESGFVVRTKNLETWDDVISLTNDIWVYSKKEQFKLKNADPFSFGIERAAIDNDDYFDDEYINDNDNDESITIPEDIAQLLEEFFPTCNTDEKFRENEASLVDDKCKKYVYVNIPKPENDLIVTPWQKVQSQLRDFYMEKINNNNGLTQKVADTNLKEFKEKNEKYVDLLVKEFEMKKAAKVFSKTKVSDTGDIDISKLSNYKFDDNIFKKVMVVPKGKSHGLILLLDGSGSMEDNMSGSIEQILVLSMFCRKVNIPFRVLCFNDDISVIRLDNDIPPIPKDSYFQTKNTFFQIEKNNIALGYVKLREYLNSDMSKKQFNDCLWNMVCLMKSYEPFNYIGRPRSETLSSTPLNEAIIAVADVMVEFKKKHGLDITNLVIVQDGDSDRTESFYDHNLNYNSFDNRNANVVIQDKSTHFQKKLEFSFVYEQRQLVTQALLEWFTHKTGSKVIGFFVAPQSKLKSNLRKKFVFDDRVSFKEKEIKDHAASTNLINKIYATLKAQNFIVSSNPGYSKFFFVLGGQDLRSDDVEIEVDGTMTANKLKNAFMKMYKKRNVSRVMVSKFVEDISF
jgi:hypothetical protein